MIGLQFMMIVAIDAPLHLKREFFSKNSSRDPQTFVQIISCVTLKALISPGSTVNPRENRRLSRSTISKPEQVIQRIRSASDP